MNKLIINIEKSCYVIIDNINKQYFDNNIYIDNKPLNIVECYTFLGMYILMLNLSRKFTLIIFAKVYQN